MSEEVKPFKDAVEAASWVSTQPPGEWVGSLEWMRRALATIRADKAEIAWLRETLVAVHEILPPLSPRSNIDPAQDARDAAAEIARLTAALEKAPCERAVEGAMQIAALHGLNYHTHTCGQCASCLARAAMNEAKEKT